MFFMHLVFNSMTLIFALMLLICLSLGVSLWRIVRDKAGSKRPVRSLSIRILLSLLLLLFLVIAALKGWIHPHAING
jgi:Protein of unknown function (DUF2909)